MLATLLLLQLSAAQAGPCDAESASARQVRAIADGIVDADNARDIVSHLMWHRAGPERPGGR